MSDDDEAVTGGAEAAAPATGDRLLLHSQSETGVRVLRQRRGQIELGELRPMREGKPIEGEVVRLAPTGRERLFDVETLYEPPPQRSAKGPPKVASAAFRAEWDRIFGAAEAAPEDAGDPEPDLLN